MVHDEHLPKNARTFQIFLSDKLHPPVIGLSDYVASQFDNDIIVKVGWQASFQAMREDFVLFSHKKVLNSFVFLKGERHL